MKNHSFMFLDSDFPDISNFCLRMEKNIVEGDGVDAVIWAGKIAERVTYYITRFLNKNMDNLDQKTKLITLFNNGIIQKDIYDQLNSIRHFRNIATHNILRDEMIVARKSHRSIFHILCFFYGTYKGEESYFKLTYHGISYQHDENFLNQIKSNICANRDELDNGINEIPLAQHHFNHNVSKIFNQNNVYFNEDLNVYTAFFNYGDKKITIGHFKTKDVAVKRGLNFVLGDDFRVFKHFNMCLPPDKLKNGKYSKSKGIDFDEDEKFWTASFDGHHLGYFISENSAIIARKEFIDTLPLPEPKNGFYSNYKEISFDKNHKLWYIKKDGKILDYYDSEREAIENLSDVFHLDIDLKDLGIIQDESDGKWKIFYKNKYVATCDTKNQAIRQRLNYISGFAQPKRNKDGLFSIHKGISYDEKNMIWILTIKGERIGFFDSEEDAFNFKKEFLKSKGFDVSKLIFHKEESFDDDFDFKVKINSDENAVVYDGVSDEWIVYFMGIEKGRCSSEDEAKKLRKTILNEMPYPPRKSNRKYSFIEGIDYDLNRHLWLAKNKEEIIGYFDSEEDAFYGLKETLIKEGIDVKDMHFINSDIGEDENNSKEDLACDVGYDSLAENKLDANMSSSEDLNFNSSKSVSFDSPDDVSSDSEVNVSSDCEVNVSSGSLVNVSSDCEVNVSSDSEENESQNKVLSYCDIFKSNTDNDIFDSSFNDEINDDNKNAKDGLLETESNSKVISNQDLLDEDNVQFESSGSLDNIDEYKKSSFYGIAKKENHGKISYEFSLSDFEDDGDEGYGEELDLNATDLDKDNGFSNLANNFFKNSNPKNLKEIKFNCYDSKNFKREISLSYGDEDIFISLDGMVHEDKLKNILFSNLFENLIKLDFSKDDSEYFKIFLRLHYRLESTDFNSLIQTLSILGWDFDLLTSLGLSLNLDLNSFKMISNNLNKKLVNDNPSQSLKEISNNDNIVDVNNQSAKFKDNLSLYGSVSNKVELNEDLREFNDAKDNNLKSKDYLNENEVSKRKTYSKQSQIVKKSKSKPEKVIIRGGVRVSSEEANELDNAKENKEIKSNIINKKPEKVKEYKTYSLDSVLEAQKAREEADINRGSYYIDSLEENENLVDVSKPDVSEMDDVSVSDFVLEGDVSEMDNISESTLVSELDVIESDVSGSGFVSELDVIESDVSGSGFVSELDVIESDVSGSGFVSELDVIESDVSGSDLDDACDYESYANADELFGDDSSSSFEEELQNISSLNADDLSSGENDEKDLSEKSIKTVIGSIKSNEDSKDETKNDSIISNAKYGSKNLDGLEFSGEESLATLESFDDLSVNEISSNQLKEEEKNNKTPKKIKKAKKVKKVKRVSKDAFDERYANSTEIEYDEENDKWMAFLGGELIKSFSTPKEAYIERKKLLRRKVRRPKKGLNGKYSNFDGVDFDTKEGLWSISVNDVIIGYSLNELDAIRRRRIFIDLILDKIDISEDEFNEDVFNEMGYVDIEDLFEDLTDDDLDELSSISLRKVKKDLNQF